MTFERTLLSVQGYLELGMLDEAVAELDSLPEELACSEAAMQMKLFILMKQRAWRQAVEVCENLRCSAPGESTGYIHGAFCLHELGRTVEARDLLLEGPLFLRKEATYHYNMGCYAAVLGNLQEASEHLETSFKMDKKFREVARIDPDLRALRDHLA